MCVECNTSVKRDRSVECNTSVKRDRSVECNTHVQGNMGENEIKNWWPKRRFAKLGFTK